MANVFDQFEGQATDGGANVFDAFTPAAPDLGRAAASGVNKLLPQLLGMPVDLLSLVTGESKPVGGSQWIQRKIAEAAGVDPFANPSPNDPTARFLHTAANVAASGAIAPASALPRVAGNIARTVPAAVGAAGAEAAFPDSPLAPLVGALVPTVGQAALRGMGAQVAPEAKAAIEAGYTVSPAQAKPTLKNKLLEGVSTKEKVGRVSAERSQPVTDAAVRKDIGLRGEGPLSEAELEVAKRESGAVYNQIRAALPEMTVNDKFIDRISKLAGEGQAGDFQAAAKRFPGQYRNDAITALQDELLSTRTMSSTEAVQFSKDLRRRASANLKSFDDAGKQALGQAERNAALALESLVEDNLRATGKGALADVWGNARTRLAKINDIETALDARGNVDARVLARMQDKGAPLTGGLKRAADFGANFRDAARTPTAMGSPAPNLSLGALGFRYGLPGMAGYLGAGAPGVLGAEAFALTAPPLLRRAIMSRAYQRGLTEPVPMNAFAPYVAGQE